MKLVRLGDIAQVGAGQGAPQDPSAFSLDGLPFIRAGSLDALCSGGNIESLERINEASARKHGMKLYPKGTIVFAKSGMSATKNRVFVLPKPAYVVSHLATLEVKSEIKPIYLQHFLGHYQIARLIQDPAYPSIGLEQIARIEIELPSLPEQQRIAGILARADRLRRLRRYALELSEGYLQAVFMEMFGDPVRNPKGWQRAKVAELGEVQTGNTPSREQLEYYGSYIEWIKSDNILDDQMYVSHSRELLSEEGEREGRVVDAGALLVTCIAGSLSSVGSAALTDRRVTFNQQINTVTPRRDVNSLFLYGLFRIAQPFVQQNASAGMKHIITKSKLEELTLIKPPLSLQAEFGQVAQSYERLRAQQREAARQAEQLFGALLDRAFRGEL